MGGVDFDESLICDCSATKLGVESCNTDSAAAAEDCATLKIVGSIFEIVVPLFLLAPVLYQHRARRQGSLTESWIVQMLISPACLIPNGRQANRPSSTLTDLPAVCPRGPYWVSGKLSRCNAIIN